MKYTASNKPQRLSKSGLTRYFEALIQKASKVKIPLKFWPFLFRWIPFWTTWISNFVSMATVIMTLKLTLNQEESRMRRRSNKDLQANTSIHTQVGSLSHILFFNRIGVSPASDTREARYLSEYLQIYQK